MRVSIATFPIRPYASVADLAAHIAELASDARSEGSCALLLPEMVNVGLLWTDADAVSSDPRQMGAVYARTLTRFLEPFKEAISHIAQETGVAIIGASFWHKTDGKGTNTAFAFLPDGSIHGQDKLHPTRPEFAIDTVGGSSIGYFELGGVKAAVLICYDIQFPELTRPLVDAGVQVIFVPSLTGKRGYWRVRHASHARSQENQIFVCVSPIFGNLGIPRDLPLEACGGAYVTCPIDNRFAIEDGLFARAEADAESLLTVNLDFDLLKLSRDRGEIRPLMDRRPDLYAEIQQH